MFDKIIINVGCGKTRIPNSIGLDRVEISGFVNTVHDLNCVPYPFHDNYADEIHCYHVLEHLDNPVQKLEELHRILKPDGTLFLRVPHFSSNGAFTDITHKRPFSYFSFDPFLINSYHNWYSRCKFKILHRKIKYLGQYPNSGLYEKYIHGNKCPLILRPIVILINFMIKINPFFFERIWCYWVGGACEIEFTFKKNTSD